MRSFAAGGNVWYVEVNALVLMRAKSQGVDLRSMYAGRAGWERLAELVDDPVSFAPMLWLMVSDQAAKLSVAQDAFYALLAGDTLAAAQDAFTRSLFDFFPDPRARTLAHQAMDKAAAQRILPIPSSSVTSSQELPASTLGATPSLSSGPPPSSAAMKTGCTPPTSCASLPISTAEKDEPGESTISPDGRLQSA